MESLWKEVLTLADRINTKSLQKVTNKMEDTNEALLIKNRFLEVEIQLLKLRETSKNSSITAQEWIELTNKIKKIRCDLMENIQGKPMSKEFNKFDMGGDLCEFRSKLDDLIVYYMKDKSSDKSYLDYVYGNLIEN